MRFARFSQRPPGFALSTCCLFFCIIGLMITLSCRNTLADETSEWIGIFRDPSAGIIKIDLSIGKDNQYSMHYGVPRSCRMDLEELQETKREIALKVKETSGGFCDDIYQADLTITKDSASAWTATIEKQDIDFSESYQLLKEED